MEIGHLRAGVTIIVPDLVHGPYLMLLDGVHPADPDGAWVQVYGRTLNDDRTLREFPRRMTTVRLDQIRVITGTRHEQASENCAAAWQQADTE